MIEAAIAQVGEELSRLEMKPGRESFAVMVTAIRQCRCYWENPEEHYPE